MFTLGDVADILDSALDTGISIVDALAKLSDVAEDGSIDRNKGFETLNINNDEDLANLDNVLYKEFNDNLVNDNEIDLEHVNNSEQNKSPFSNDPQKQRNLEATFSKSEFLRQKRNTYALEQSPCANVNDAAIQGIPIIEALGDLCNVADNFLNDYNEIEDAVGDQNSETAVKKIQHTELENIINDKVNQILESFKKLDITVDELSKKIIKEEHKDNSNNSFRRPIKKYDTKRSTYVLNSKAVTNVADRVEDFTDAGNEVKEVDAHYKSRPNTYVLNQQPSKLENTLNKQIFPPEKLPENPPKVVMRSKKGRSTYILNNQEQQNNNDTPDQFHKSQCNNINDYNTDIFKNVENETRFIKRFSMNLDDTNEVEEDVSIIPHLNPFIDTEDDFILKNNPVGNDMEVTDFSSLIDANSSDDSDCLWKNKSIKYDIKDTVTDNSSLLNLNSADDMQAHANKRGSIELEFKDDVSDGTCSSLSDKFLYHHSNEKLMKGYHLDKNNEKYETSVCDHKNYFSDNNINSDKNFPSKKRLASATYSLLSKGEALGSKSNTTTYDMSPISPLSDRSWSQPDLNVSPRRHTVQIRKPMMNKLNTLQKVMSLSLNKLNKLHDIKRDVTFSHEDVLETVSNLSNDSNICDSTSLSNDVNLTYDEEVILSRKLQRSYSAPSELVESLDLSQEDDEINMDRQFSSSSGGTYTVISPCQSYQFISKESTFVLIDANESDKEPDDISSPVPLTEKLLYSENNDMSDHLTNVDDIIKSLEGNWFRKSSLNKMEPLFKKNDKNNNDKQQLPRAKTFQNLSLNENEVTDLKDIPSNVAMRENIGRRNKYSKTGTYVIQHDPKSPVSFTVDIDSAESTDDSLNISQESIKNSDISGKSLSAAQAKNSIGHQTKSQRAKHPSPVVKEKAFSESDASRGRKSGEGNTPNKNVTTVHKNYLRRKSRRYDISNSQKDDSGDEPLSTRLAALRMQLEEKRRQFELEKKQKQETWSQERAKVLKNAFINGKENEDPLVAPGQTSWEVHFDSITPKTSEAPNERAQDPSKSKSYVSPHDYIKRKQMENKINKPLKDGSWFVNFDNEQELNPPNPNIPSQQNQKHNEENRLQQKPVWRGERLKQNQFHQEHQLRNQELIHASPYSKNQLEEMPPSLEDEMLTRQVICQPNNFKHSVPEHQEQIQPNTFEQNQPKYQEQMQPNTFEQNQPKYQEQMQPNTFEQNQPKYQEQIQPNTFEQDQPKYQEQMRPNKYEQNQPKYPEQIQPNTFEQDQPKYQEQMQPNTFEQNQPKYQEQMQPNTFEQNQPKYQEQMQPNTFEQNQPKYQEQMRPNKYEQNQPKYQEQIQPNTFEQDQPKYQEQIQPNTFEQDQPKYQEQIQPNTFEQNQPKYQEQMQPNTFEQNQPKYQEQIQPNTFEQNQPKYQEQIQPNTFEQDQPKYQEQMRPNKYEQNQPKYPEQIQPNTFEQNQPKYQEQMQPNTFEQNQPKYQEQMHPNTLEQSQPKYQEQIQPNTFEQSQPKYQEQMKPNTLGQKMSTPEEQRKEREIIRSESSPKNFSFQDELAKQEQSIGSSDSLSRLKALRNVTSDIVNRSYETINDKQKQGTDAQRLSLQHNYEKGMIRDSKHDSNENLLTQQKFQRSMSYDQPSLHRAEINDLTSQQKSISDDRQQWSYEQAPQKSFVKPHVVSDESIGQSTFNNITEPSVPTSHSYQSPPDEVNQQLPSYYGESHEQQAMLKDSTNLHDAKFQSQRKLEQYQSPYLGSEKNSIIEQSHLGSNIEDAGGRWIQQSSNVQKETEQMFVSPSRDQFYDQQLAHNNHYAKYQTRDDVPDINSSKERNAEAPFIAGDYSGSRRRDDFPNETEIDTDTKPDYYQHEVLAQKQQQGELERQNQLKQNQHRQQEYQNKQHQDQHRQQEYQNQLHQDQHRQQEYQNQLLFQQQQQQDQLHRREQNYNQQQEDERYNQPLQELSQQQQQQYQQHLHHQQQRQQYQQQQELSQQQPQQYQQQPHQYKQEEELIQQQPQQYQQQPHQYKQQEELIQQQQQQYQQQQQQYQQQTQQFQQQQQYQQQEQYQQQNKPLQELNRQQQQQDFVQTLQATPSSQTTIDVLPNPICKDGQQDKNAPSTPVKSDTNTGEEKSTAWALTFGEDFQSPEMTPDQKKKKERFLRNRLKKQEEEKAKKEADIEKKRKKEELLAEKKLKQEETQRLEYERLKEKELMEETVQLQQDVYSKRLHEMTYQTQPQQQRPMSQRLPNRETPEKAPHPRIQSASAAAPPYKRSVSNPFATPESAGDQLSSQFSEYKGPMLYQKPSGKSNRKIIQNSIMHCCLCGEVNKEAKKKCIEALNQSEGNHFLVLFREGLKFRSVYEYNPEFDLVSRIYGIGPKSITSKMMTKYLKYNSGGKEFNVIDTKHLSIQIDGIMIKKELWEKKPVAPSRIDLNRKKLPARNTVNR